MRPTLLSAALVVFCTAAGCSRQQPAQPAADASAPATDVMKMAALCHEHGGDWIKERGCAMTAKLCVSTYHGAWKAPRCAVPRSELKDCNQAGGQPADAGACTIDFLTLDASQYMK